MRRIVFVWIRIGLIQADRCEAAASLLGKEFTVLGVEIIGASDHSDSNGSHSSGFIKRTIFPNGAPRKWRALRLFFALIVTCIRERHAPVFLCHYHKPAVWLAALILRGLGRRVFMMNNSTFSDRRRRRFRELTKAVLVAPYHGALTSSARAKEYLQFLGVPSAQIAYGYNTMSLNRIRSISAIVGESADVNFFNRVFLIDARSLDGASLRMPFDAYKTYLSGASNPRPLIVIGGPNLKNEIAPQLADRGLDNCVSVNFGLNKAEFYMLLARTLSVIVPAVDDKFNSTIIEAQTLGVPVIVSDTCVASEPLVRSGLTGFIVEHDNASGFAYFMTLLSEDEMLWREISEAAKLNSDSGDVLQFAHGVETLVRGSGGLKTLPYRSA